MPKEPLKEVRVDRWLFAARFYKTRSQSAKACDGGKVKVNGDTAKPHKLIHIGDKLTVHVHSRYRNVDVLGLADRGLPPPVARELYHEEKVELSEDEKEIMEIFKASEKRFRQKYKGRPTKRERRDLINFKTGMGDQNPSEH